MADASATPRAAAALHSTDQDIAAAALHSTDQDVAAAALSLGRGLHQPSLDHQNQRCCKRSDAGFPLEVHLEPPRIGGFRSYCVIERWPSHPQWIGIHYGPFADEVWKERLDCHGPGPKVTTWHRSLEYAQEDYREMRRRICGDVDPIPITYFKWAPDDPSPVRNSDGSITLHLPKGWWALAPVPQALSGDNLFPCSCQTRELAVSVQAALSKFSCKA
jgi:hypothetical protein